MSDSAITTILVGNCSDETTSGPATTAIAFSLNSTRNCRDKFYCDERGLCVPLCSKWNLYPLSTSIAFDVVIILCSIIGGASAMVILVICCLRFKKM